MTHLIDSKDKQLLSEIAMDNETGRHLISKRSEEYMLERLELGLAFHSTLPTGRQMHMIAYIETCEWPGVIRNDNGELTFEQFEQLES